MINQTKIRHDHIISANSKVVRNINRAIILNCIRERQPICRADIARLTRLNKSTVSSIVLELLNEDLLHEHEEKTTSVGRNPINLSLKTGRNFFGAISFDSATTRVAVVDVDGMIVHTAKIQTRQCQAEEFIVECIDQLIQLRTTHHLSQFKGVGVSVAGIVDPVKGKVVFSSNLEWEDVDISEILTSHFPKVPVVAVENDAKSAALAELWFGKHNVRLSNFVFLSVGRGIGAGIVIDRRILSGESYLAGEFGHMLLVEDGIPCRCGKNGCWEAYASDQATVRRYIAAKNGGGPPTGNASIDDVIAAARNADREAVTALKTSGRSLGLGIANIIKAVDPEIIIVGGHITRVWDIIQGDVIEATRAHSLAVNGSGPLILSTSLSKRPSLLGGAALAMSKSFGEVRVTL